MISSRFWMVATPWNIPSVFQESRLCSLLLFISSSPRAWGLEMSATPRPRVPNLQLLPLKNQMAYLLQTLSVVFPGFIKISSQCKLNGVQAVHERNMGLARFIPGKGYGRSQQELMWYHIRREIKSQTEPDYRRTIKVIIYHGNSYYLFESGRQVLDKKPPEVVECLQLPGLCECKEGSSAQTTTKQKTGCRH